MRSRDRLRAAKASPLFGLGVAQLRSGAGAWGLGRNRSVTATPQAHVRRAEAQLRFSEALTPALPAGPNVFGSFARL